MFRKIIVSLKPSLSNSLSKTFSNLLPSSSDLFNGRIVDVSDLPAERNVFATNLKLSVDQWQKEKVTGIWIHIPKEKICFLEEALKMDFYMHHCEDDKIIVAKWMVEGVENKIPDYSTHYVGSGGVVLNDKNEILLVKENVKTRKGWGIPGGQSNQNELLTNSSMREVFEETGIRTEFVELLGIRELSNFRFGCSEIFFLSHLRALNTDFNICKYEILEARWFDKEEVRKVIDAKDAWSPTVLDSIKIGLLKMEGRLNGLDCIKKITHFGSPKKINVKCIYCDYLDEISREYFYYHPKIIE